MQVIVNESKPQSRKILTSQLYTNETVAELMKDFAGEDVTGGGWVTGISLLGAGSSLIVGLYDGASGAAMPILEVSPRTVLNVNIELPASNWRRFDDGVFIGAVLPSGARLFVHYYQDA